MKKIVLYLNQSSPNLFDNGILPFFSSVSPIVLGKKKKTVVEGHPQGIAGTDLAIGENDKSLN